MTRHKIRISKKNRKMGEIPSVSLPPVTSCPDGIPCKKVCYVRRNMLAGPYGKAIAASYAANWEFWNADGQAYFDQLNKWIKRNRPRYFRFHVSGDFPSEIYLWCCFAVAAGNPDTRFLAFTKAHQMLIPYQHVPSNFSIVASMWPGWKSEPPKGYRKAFVVLKAGPADPRIPPDAIECPGLCDACGMCFQLAELGRDVVFHEH